MVKKNKVIFLLIGSLKVGGVEKLATRIEESLTSRGLTVYLILLKNKIELPVKDKSVIKHLNTQDYKLKPIKILVAFINLWKLYFKYRPNRIISLSSGLNVLLLLFCLPNQVLRVDTNLFAVKSKLYRRKILKLIGYLPHVKNVIVPSDGLRMAFENYLPSKSFDKFVTIYNPLPLSKLEIPKSSPFDCNIVNLVSVGRLTSSKGYEQLINCFKKAKFSHQVQLYIIGSGPLEEKLHDLIKELNCEDTVKLLGFKKNPEYYIYYSDGFILNTHFESFGNVYIEALVQGVPVISNDCDYGPREIIFQNKNGLLYNNSKDENLIEQLENYTNNSAYREKLKSNTDYQLHRFDIQVITDKWQSLLVS